MGKKKKDTSDSRNDDSINNLNARSNREVTKEIIIIPSKNESKIVNTMGKILISETILKEIIEKYKDGKSWDRISNEYPFSKNTIIRRSRGFLGSDVYKELVAEVSGRTSEKKFHKFTKKEFHWLEEKGIDARSLRKQKGRWYWIAHDLLFKDKNTGENKSGLAIAKDFFRIFILDDVKKKLNHPEDQIYSPSADDLRNTKYNRYFNIVFNFMTLNDLLESVGLPIRRQNLYADLSIEELKIFFKDKIFPFLRDKFEIPEQVAPSYEHVHGYYRGFLNALYKKKIIYTIFIRDLGYIPQEDRRTESGKFFHLVVNLILTNFIDKKYDFKYYSEIKIYSPHNNKRIDGLIKLNTSLRDILKQNLEKLNIDKVFEKRFQQYLELKYYLLFDYTNAISRFDAKIHKKYVYDKISKYTPNNKFSLFIVSVLWPEKINNYVLSLPSEIEYRENDLNYNINTEDVELISPQLLIDLFKIKGENLFDLKNAIKFNKVSDIENLIAVFNKYSHIKLHDTNEFIKTIGRNPYNEFKL